MHYPPFVVMAGCKGLIDTAMKTVETGYIQCRLVKALEDIMTGLFKTHSVTSCLWYGMDRAFIEHQYIETYRLTDKQFKNSYYCVNITNLT